MAWQSGAAVVAMRPIDLLAPAKYINENNITIWFSVPSVISLLQKQNYLKQNCFPSLRLSLFCGEGISLKQIHLWSQAAPNSKCENLYGPTELTVACSAYTYDVNGTNEQYNGMLSIGKLFDNLDYVLVDNNDRISHKEGELCVRGTQCFNGYLNQEHNNHTFIELTINGKTFSYYRTGDRVRQVKSGDLIFLGRKDQQVKINGYRVELGDIEACLMQLDDVERAIVHYSQEEKQLSAFIEGDTTEPRVRELVGNSLPQYMIPQKLIINKSSPLNANGKTDRKLIFELFQPLHCA